MKTLKRGPTLVALSGLALALVAGATLWPSAPAGAQGMMAAPACQCSAPTAIPSLATNVVHCLCGAMSCVLSEPAGKGASLMQCVK